jgi:hypothetical protein
MATNKSSPRRASAPHERTSVAAKPRKSPAEGPTKQRTTRARRAETQSEAPQQAPDGAGRLSAEEIRAMVSDAAYLRAQARNFAPGHDQEDWYAAEAEIQERLARGC